MTESVSGTAAASTSLSLAAEKLKISKVDLPKPQHQLSSAGIGQKIELSTLFKSASQPESNNQDSDFAA